MTLIEESEKNWLKTNIQKTKIIVSCSITPWQIDGETMETVTEFIFLGSKITVGGDCSCEIKRCMHFGRSLERNDNPLQYSCLEIATDRGAWPCQGIAKSQTALSTYTHIENKRKKEKYGIVNNDIKFK